MSFLPNALVAKLAYDHYERTYTFHGQIAECVQIPPNDEAITAVQMARMEIVKELRDRAEMADWDEYYTRQEWANVQWEMRSFADELERAAMESL